jgi:PAS domain S-box-containing protein
MAKAPGNSGTGRILVRPLPVFLIAAFIIPAAAVVILAYLFLRHEAYKTRLEKQAELAAIADLKVQALTQWLAERKGNGNAISKNPFFASKALELMRTPGDGNLRNAFEDWLENFRDAHGYYSAQLLDSAGNVMAGAGKEKDMIGAHARNLLANALNKQQVIISNLHWGPKKDLHIDLMVPIRPESTGGENRDVPHLAFLFRINPHEYFYPLIQTWPTPSASAETLLFERQGDEVIYLNELRHAKNTALKLKVPITDPNQLVSKAARGDVVVDEGLDYRGVPVVGVMRKVPGTEWILEAKVDQDEIYALIRNMVFYASLLVVLVIFSAAAGTMMFWNRKKSLLYRRLYETEAAHRLLLSRFGYLSRHANDMILLMDTDGRIIDANDRAVEVYGYPRGELIGMNARILRPEAARGEVDARFAELLQKGALVYEIVQQRRDGTLLDVEASMRTIGEEGKTFFQAIMRDISERKRMEEALRQHNEELVRFTNAVSHDLRSPLVTIRTFLGFLDQDIKDSNTKRLGEDLDHIRHAAEKMSGLLEELLELSRIGRKMNPPADMTLKEVAGEALELVSGRVASKGARVLVTDAPVVISGDRRRIVEVFQNLLDNAAKFMGDQAQPLIEIGVEGSAAELVLFVRDNGMGIDPRHKYKLFGMFEKLHPGTEGSGMGLALVKRIIEVHGGRIWAESDGPGKGSIFRFTLRGMKTAEAGKEAAS